MTTQGLVTPTESHAGPASGESTGDAEFFQVIEALSNVARPMALAAEPHPVYHIRSLGPLGRRQGVPTPVLSQDEEFAERSGPVPDLVHTRPSLEVARPMARMRMGPTIGPTIAVSFDAVGRGSGLTPTNNSWYPSYHIRYDEAAG
jgi:hypothetical protein